MTLVFALCNEFDDIYHNVLESKVVCNNLLKYRIILF